MSDVVKRDDLGVIGLIRTGDGHLTIPKPFERDIFLFDTHIAGTSHIAGFEELEPYLYPGDMLEFFREPDNQYDELAIVIKNTDGVKLGYVPKVDNVVFSRLMDAGKLLFGRVSSKEHQGNWWKIAIKVLLRD